MNLLHQINSTDFSENELLILEYFIDHEKSLPYMSLNDICKDLFISNATIVRFCQKIGFNGFNELKYSLRKASRESTGFSTWSVMQHHTSILKDFIDGLDSRQLETICKEVTQSDSLYIYGRGLSSLPARYMYSMFNAIDIPCIYIDWIDFLLAISVSFPENATLILFTNYGEKEIYEPIARRCHKKNVKIIWISSVDIDTSLLAADDICITAPELPSENTHLRTKMTAFVFVQIVIEYILTQK